MKKILGILVCTLLIATALPAVKSMKNNTITTKTPDQPLSFIMENWTETQKIIAADGAMYDHFGASVSVDGDTALIGAYWDDDNGADSGSAYVFTRTGTTWTQQAKLLASDGAAGDAFGYTVSLDGDTALIAASLDDDNGDSSGSAYVFTRTGTTWTHQAKLLPSDGAAGDNLCWVSLNEDTALLGVPGDDDNGEHTGSAYVFIRTGTVWTQQAKLIASDAAAQDWFGYGVSIDGDTALIGSELDDDNGIDSGSAYIFIRSGTIWTQQAKLSASDAAAGDRFGAAVSLKGDTAFIGAPLDDNIGADFGSTYVFTRAGSSWSEQDILRITDSNNFGRCISVDDDYTLIGEHQNAYIYKNTGTTWSQEAILSASEMNVFTVSLCGNTAFIGDDSDGPGAVHVFMPESAQPNIEFELSSGLGVNMKITNTGTANATDVYWQIHVEGGILGRINKTMSGTIDILAGKTETVGTGMFLGFGPFSITAKVNDKEQNATGIQLIIFSIVK